MRNLSALRPEILGISVERLSQLSNASWTSGADFKRAFYRAALTSQMGLCAYCMNQVGEEFRNRPDIEHFADKSKYGQWTFEILNLSLACKYCNQTRKGKYDVVVTLARNYGQCSFALIHPYLDDVEKHLKGGYPALQTKPTIPQPLTLKGARTIRLFKLDSIFALSIWTRVYDDLEAKRNMDESERLQYEKAKDELGGY